MPSSKATATQAVILFSHYTFSLFLLKLILPFLLLLLLLLLLYALILPFSHPFSKVSPSLLIFFSCQRPLGSPHIFCRLLLSLDIVCTSQIRVYDPTINLLPVLLLKAYLNMTNINPKVSGYLDYLLEMALVLQRVDLVALPSVGANFEFLMKYTWLCMQSYFIFIKS